MGLLAHTGLGGMGDGTGILRQVSRAHDRQRGFRVWFETILFTIDLAARDVVRSD